MNVQELIDRLELIEEKTLRVVTIEDDWGGYVDIDVWTRENQREKVVVILHE